MSESRSSLIVIDGSPVTVHEGVGFLTLHVRSRVRGQSPRATANSAVLAVSRLRPDLWPVETRSSVREREQKYGSARRFRNEE